MHRSTFSFRLFAVLFICVIFFSTNICLAQNKEFIILCAQNNETGRFGRQQQRLDALNESAKPWLGVFVKEARGQSGVLVESVLNGSPAEHAGILKGDIITHFNNTAITEPSVLTMIVGNLKVGESYPAALIRNGKPINLSITLLPRPINPSRFSSNQQTDEISESPSPRKGVLDINVLKYVLINPTDGLVTFVGKYDPAYNTGPIPYADYLKVAMQHIYPSFSLDPTIETKNAIKKAADIISNDINKMNDLEYADKWTKKVFDLLMNDSSLQADNSRFFKHCAEVIGISGDELKRMYDAATGKIDISNTEFMGLAAKMVRGVGLIQAGNALDVLSIGGTPEEMLSAMADTLGLFDEYKELALRGLSPEEFRKEEIILVISELCRHFEADENVIQSKISSIRTGESADIIIDYMGESLNKYIVNKSGRKMINGLILGPDLLSKLYNLPKPKAKLVFEDLPSDSTLGDIFFKSDYRLKSVCTFPDAKEKILSHITTHELIQKEASDDMNKKLCGADFMAGNRLVPDEVVLRVSPKGDIVKFEKSKIKIIGWLMEMNGDKDSETVNFITNALNKHSSILTENYEEYAKVYPEWHKFSEAAKIIALARWAKNNGYLLRTTAGSDVKITQPSTIDGFWSAVFEAGEDSQYITFIFEGGASFAKSEGEGWLIPNKDAAVTSDVSKQLAASAVFAQQALGAALKDDLESARELSEKSALAMTGEIDFNRLPSLENVPLPTDFAAYAEATKTAVEEVSKCIDKIKAAGKEIENINLAAGSDEGKENLKQQLIKEQDDAREKLNQILQHVKNYQTDPNKAKEAVVLISSSSVDINTVSPNSASSSSSNPSSNTSASFSAANDNDTEKLAKELDEVNKQIVSTREALLRLNASIMSNRNLFEEWEKSSSEAFDRCLSTIGDVALDFGISGLAKRQQTIYELAKKLPNKPQDVIEKYRYLASLTQRMKEAKSVYDLDGLAQRENKTQAQLWETLRDGLGQISGLLSLDETVPGIWWKYGSLAFDTAYSLTELWQTWKNIKLLENNNEKYTIAVSKLASRMQQLVDRQKQIKQKLASGGELEKISN